MARVHFMVIATVSLGESTVEQILALVEGDARIQLPEKRAGSLRCSIAPTSEMLGLCFDTKALCNLAHIERMAPDI